MTKLCELNINSTKDDKDLKELLQALEDSLKQNTLLWTISICEMNPSVDIAQRYMPRIPHLLAMNRVDRRYLMAANHVPIGLWPLVLSKSSGDADGIYFVLT